MKILVALLFAILIPTAAYADIVDTAENTAVVLMNASGDMFCSGTVIATDGTDEVIATARHCAEVGPDSVQFFDGDHGLIGGFIGSPRADVMILFVHSMRRHEAASVSTKPIRRNQDLFAFGMPMGDYWSFARAYSTTGSNPSLDPQWLGSLLIECNSCNHGSSGGGVFDKSGQLVGVIVAGNDHATGHMLMEPVQTVVDVLETLGRQR